MKVLLDYQDVLKMIKNNVNPLFEGAMNAQRATHTEEKKKDFKVLFLIHQCVNTNKFEKFADCESSKQVWEILENAYIGDDKVKVVRLQAHKHGLELIQMEENGTINDLTMRITRLVNKLKTRREMITKQYVIAKVLCSLMIKFDNIVAAIEELNDFATMSKEELQISLEAHAKRMEDINCDKAKKEIALQARFNEKDKKSKGKWPIRLKRIFQNFGGRESKNSKNSVCQKGESNCNKNGGQRNFRGERRRINRSKMQCFVCQKFGHFPRDCNANKKETKVDEAKVARQVFNKDHTFLVMNENTT